MAEVAGFVEEAGLLLADDEGLLSEDDSGLLLADVAEVGFVAFGFWVAVVDATELAGAVFWETVEVTEEDDELLLFSSFSLSLSSVFPSSDTYMSCL